MCCFVAPTQFVVVREARLFAVTLGRVQPSEMRLRVLGMLNTVGLLQVHGSRLELFQVFRMLEELPLGVLKLQVLRAERLQRSVCSLLHEDLLEGVQHAFLTGQQATEHIFHLENVSVYCVQAVNFWVRL